ncbi:hypothetical protein A2U01_0025899, partial [Trifolium medium]|nr:hypothetical protein [Trifolium medium]
VTQNRGKKENRKNNKKNNITGMVVEVVLVECESNEVRDLETRSFRIGVERFDIEANDEAREVDLGDEEVDQ